MIKPDLKELTLEIVEQETSDEIYQHIFVRVDGEYVTDMSGFLGKGNAHLIVKAVKFHDELLRLCKWSLACMKDDHTSLSEELRSVIARVESENP